MNLRVVDVPIPRAIAAVHQIELTSRCNLKCVYCPSPDIQQGKYPGRPAVDMDRPTFERALEWVRHYVRAGTQKELNLAGIGESTLHPDLVEYVRLAREAVGPDVKLIFATNGIAVTKEMVAALKPYRPEIWVSLHRPEKAAHALPILHEADLLRGTSLDPVLNANDWAGQVKWGDTQGFRAVLPCTWMRVGRVFVLADGRISPCCLDASGSGVIGHVRDEVGSLLTRPYDLCKSCYQEIAIQGWDQRAGKAVS